MNLTSQRSKCKQRLEHHGKATKKKKRHKKNDSDIP